jgi:hypothetical protein
MSSYNLQNVTSRCLQIYYDILFEDTVLSDASTTTGSRVQIYQVIAGYMELNGAKLCWLSMEPCLCQILKRVDELVHEEKIIVPRNF